MPRRAYSYIRFSTPEQRLGDSKRRQLDFARRVCEARGWVLDDSLMLVDEGTHAFRGQHRRADGRKVRPLAAFLEAVRSGLVGPGCILILENIDRLSREEIDPAWELFRDILKAGVDVVTESPERHYTRESLNDFMAILEVKFCMYRAHDESLQKSRRLLGVWGEKKRLAAEEGRPLGRGCPGWIRLVGGQYALARGARDLLREMAAMAREGMGVLRIARQLRSTPGAPCFARTGVWSPEYVRRLLRNPALYGAYRPTTRGREDGRPVPGELVPGYYPAVMTEEEFLEVQAAIARRRGRGGRPGRAEANLFTGLLVEATSRAELSLYPSHVKGRRYRYLMLSRTARGPRGLCIPYGPVETGLRKCVAELSPADLLPRGAGDDPRHARVRELGTRVTALDHRLSILETQAADPDHPEDSLPTVLAAAAGARHARKEAALELARLKEELTTGRPEALGETQGLDRLLSEAPPDELPVLRRRLKARLRQLLEGVWVVVQPLGRQRRVIHCQLYFRGGRRHYVRMLPPGPLPAPAWDLEVCDFRAGDVGGAARDSLLPAQALGQ